MKETAEQALEKFEERLATSSDELDATKEALQQQKQAFEEEQSRAKEAFEEEQSRTKEALGKQNVEIEYLKTQLGRGVRGTTL